MKALVTEFHLPDFDPERILSLSKSGIHNYVKMPGLRYKFYLINTETKSFGAVYIFESQSDLDRFLNSERWTTAIPSVWGQQPQYHVYDIPLLVDNVQHQHVGVEAR